MKARNNKTGEIVTDFAISGEFGTVSYFDSSKTLRFAHACDKEWTILDEESEFDWQSFRVQAAKDILCAMVQSEQYNQCTDTAKSHLAIELTDELIKQLKEKEEK